MSKSEKVFTLGPAGTYSHEAAVKFFGAETEISFCPRNEEILKQTISSKGLGIVPIENSSAGLVMEVIRFWMDFKKRSAVKVIGEIQIPIRHNLLVRPELISSKELREVISHPQALAQCSRNLDDLKVMARRPTNSTAIAAKEISEDKSRISTGAIASSFAAGIYGLKILQSDLQDFSGNVTRFHVLGNYLSPVSGDDKTAIIFHVDNKPGALSEMISVVSVNRVNMSAIHSIPLGDRNFKYAFYSEIECHQKDMKGKVILKLLKELDKDLIVLGSFPKAKKKEGRQ